MPKTIIIEGGTGERETISQWDISYLLRGLEILELATKAATDMRPSAKAMQLSDIALLRMKLETVKG